MLQHSSIVKLYDATLDRNGQRLLVIMEYCDLGNLDDYMYLYIFVFSSDCLNLIIYYSKRSEEELTEDLVRHLMREISFGLQFLRLKSVVHRDLKLENILVTKVIPLSFPLYHRKYVFLDD